MGDAMDEKEQVEKFWERELASVQEGGEFHPPRFAPKRVHRIVKANDDTKKLTGDVRTIMSKACELFVRELSVRAFANSSNNGRRTVLKKDVVVAVNRCDMYDFLIDVVPRIEEHESSRTRQSAQSPSVDTAAPATAEPLLPLGEGSAQDVPVAVMLDYMRKQQQARAQFHADMERQLHPRATTHEDDIDGAEGATLPPPITDDDNTPDNAPQLHHNTIPSL